MLDATVPTSARALYSRRRTEPGRRHGHRDRHRARCREQSPGFQEGDRERSRAQRARGFPRADQEQTVRGQAGDPRCGASCSQAAASGEEPGTPIWQLRCCCWRRCWRAARARDRAARCAHSVVHGSRGRCRAGRELRSRRTRGARAAAPGGRGRRAVALARCAFRARRARPCRARPRSVARARLVAELRSRTELLAVLAAARAPQRRRSGSPDRTSGATWARRRPRRIRRAGDGVAGRRPQPTYASRRCHGLIAFALKLAAGPRIVARAAARWSRSFARARSRQSAGAAAAALDAPTCDALDGKAGEARVFARW